MGFEEKRIGWIRWCISTASFSILVNGIPFVLFFFSKFQGALSIRSISL